MARLFNAINQRDIFREIVAFVFYEGVVSPWSLAVVDEKRHLTSLSVVIPLPLKHIS